MDELGAAILGAVVGGVVGGAVGYLSSWYQERRDRARRRQATATVLLFELRIMDLALREMYRLDHPANQFAGPTFPMFDTVGSDILLFQPASVEAILTAWGYMADIRYRLEPLERGLVQRGTTWDEDLRWLARRGVEAIVPARERLLAEGGQLPRADVARLATYPVPRESVPPSPFEPEEPSQ
jgi:hypothetical protein